MFRQKDTALTIGLVCAATLAAHVLIARHLERVETTAESVESRAPLWGVVQTPGVNDWDQEFAGAPRLLTTAAYESEDPIDSPRSADRESDAPKPPLTKRQREEQDAVRAVIEEEMPETSAEERDIWFDELKSLPAEVVRDLLQVRKQLRVLSPDHPLSGPSTLHEHIPHDEPVVAIEPVAQTRQLTSSTDWSETREALEQAIAWSTHNLANAATPGYKRIEAFTGDAYRSETDLFSPLGLGCRLTTARIDLTPGELRESSRQLDLAIDGPGLFVLRDTTTGEMYYTRCGRLTSNEQGQLGIQQGDKFLVQDARGSIALPQSAMSIKVSAEGTVTAVTNQDDVETQEIGQIQLAMCVDASKLKPIGDGLFAAAPGFAPPLVKPGFRGVGVIRQGFLEQSNVDVVREQADREAWESILRTLPTTLVPRTARESIPSPQ